MAKNVDLWISALGDVEDAVTSDTVNQLCLLSLYDCILLLGMFQLVSPQFATNHSDIYLKTTANP